VKGNGSLRSIPRGEEGKGKAKPALEKKKKPMFLLYK
jgi:hypothetical protein